MTHFKFLWLIFCLIFPNVVPCLSIFSFISEHFNSSPSNIFRRKILAKLTISRNYFKEKIKMKNQIKLHHKRNLYFFGWIKWVFFDIAGSCCRWSIEFMRCQCYIEYSQWMDQTASLFDEYNQIVLVSPKIFDGGVIEHIFPFWFSLRILIHEKNCSFFHYYCSEYSAKNYYVTYP